jgi:sec-independent protein translocase protein TatB
MLDIGVTKLMIIGGIALVVIGPERLPRVARMVGTLLGRAQRYVADVKAEVGRSIELEELNKMKSEFDSAARDVEQSIGGGLDSAAREVDHALQITESSNPCDADDPVGWIQPGPSYVHPGKKWRVKRGAMPQWYKQREGVRRHVQSAAARVARHRPRPAQFL